jgi:hypothetical protein
MITSWSLNDLDACYTAYQVFNSLLAIWGQGHHGNISIVEQFSKSRRLDLFLVKHTSHRHHTLQR